MTAHHTSHVPFEPDRHRAGGPVKAYVAVMVAVALFAGLAHGSAPAPFALAAELLVVYLGVCLIRPFAGLAATVVMALISDIVTASSFPFVKNMSSPESYLYIGHFLNVSPFELGLVALTAGLIVRHDTDRRLLFRTSQLVKPMVVFAGFIVLGVAYGLATGGDKKIALTEVRAFVHLVLIFFIAVATCRTARHYRILLAAVLLGVGIHAVFALNYFSTLSAEDLAASESVMAHPAALQMVPVFVALVASFLYRGASWRLRLASATVAVPALLVFFVAKRRAAMVALVLALLVMAIVLFWRQRRTFLKIMPVLFLVFAGYVGAFWNSTSGAAFPAQAVKAVVAPTELSDRDSSSDAYRVIENIDLNFTIQSSKVFGIGFGRPFFRPYALPDIGIFALNAYIPHNSILWVWVSAGFGGFAALIYLVVKALILAGDKLRRVPRGDDLVVGVCFASFIPAFMVFAYVDIAWEPGTMVLLGTAFAYCGALLKVGPDPAPDLRADGVARPASSSVVLHSSVEQTIPAMRRA